MTVLYSQTIDEVERDLVLLHGWSLNAEVWCCMLARLITWWAGGQPGRADAAAASPRVDYRRVFAVLCCARRLARHLIGRVKQFLASVEPRFPTHRRALFSLKDAVD